MATPALPWTRLGQLGVALVLSGAILATRPASAQEKLPPAEELIAKNIEASGGEAAMNKVKNRVTEATIEMGGQKGSVILYEAAPNKALSISEIPGMGKQMQGTDGTVYWMQGPGGAMILDNEDMQAMERQTTFNPILQWKRFYTKAETIGVEAVAGSPAYKVQMTPKQGAPETWYLDQKTNLLVRMDMTQEAMGTQAVIQAYMEDYRKVDGIMIAHKMRTSAGPMEQVLTFTSVKHDVDLPADRFAPPPEVKAQLKPDTKPADKP